MTKESTVETLNFKVEGQFITDLAREWYFLEKKDYSVCEELLLSCMLCDEDSEEILQMKKQFALDIIEGRKKFVGINEFTLEDDNITIRLVQVEEVQRQLEAVKLENAQLRKENELLDKSYRVTSDMLEVSTRKADKLQQMMDKVNDKLINIIEKNSPSYRLRCHFGKSNFVDAMTFKTNILIDNTNIDEENKKLLDLCKEANIHPGWTQWGLEDMLSFYDNDTEELLDSDELVRRGFAIKQDEDEVEVARQKHLSEVVAEGEQKEEKYGWVSPSGDFIESPWGTHEEKAREIVEKNGWKEEFYEWDKNGDVVRLARDFLIYVKGYALIHNPALIGGRINADYHILTKKQNDFLFKYFMDIGDEMYANKFMGDLL